MHLKEEQIQRLGEKILNDLVTAEEVVFKGERGAALAAIKSAITADLQSEEARLYGGAGPHRIWSFPCNR